MLGMKKVAPYMRNNFCLIIPNLIKYTSFLILAHLKAEKHETVPSRFLEKTKVCS